MDKKGQMGGAAMAIIFAFVALAVIGVIQLVGVLITSKVGTSIDSSLPTDTLHTTNESVTIINDIAGDTNSTLLANDGYIANSETVVNGSTGAKVTLIRNVEYKITTQNVDANGFLTRGNFTLFNSTNTSAYGYNNTELKISYNTKEKTVYWTTKETLTSNNLDSFELGGTGQIVYAASVVILSVFGIIVMFRRG